MKKITGTLMVAGVAAMILAPGTIETDSAYAWIGSYVALGGFTIGMAILTFSNKNDRMS